MRDINEKVAFTPSSINMDRVEIAYLRFIIKNSKGRLVPGTEVTLTLCDDSPFIINEVTKNIYKRIFSYFKYKNTKEITGKTNKKGIVTFELKLNDVYVDTQGHIVSSTLIDGLSELNDIPYTILVDDD
tara:strand:+ start:28 stop:414 length:387 start_codon:yes stop_codon:yes gene_type:complete